MSKPSYEVTVSQVSGRHRIPVSAVRKNTVKILKTLRVKPCQLHLLFTGDQRIRSINRQYLNHDYVTDVIAFDGERPEKSRPYLLGDIVVSVDTAARQAREYENTFLYEVHFYICHGILHLLGWKDKTRSEREKMLKKQEAVLKKAGLEGLRG